MLRGTLDRLQALSQGLVRKSPETAPGTLKILITRYATANLLIVSGNRPLAFGLKTSSCGFVFFKLHILLGVRGFGPVFVLLFGSASQKLGNRFQIW